MQSKRIPYLSVIVIACCITHTSCWSIDSLQRQRSNPNHLFGITDHQNLATTARAQRQSRYYVDNLIDRSRRRRRRTSEQTSPSSSLTSTSLFLLRRNKGEVRVLHDAPSPPYGTTIEDESTSAKTSTNNNGDLFGRDDDASSSVVADDDRDNTNNGWNWNAASGASFGSILMQLQKKEEEMIANNETIVDDAVDLDHLDMTTKEKLTTEVDSRQGQVDVVPAEESKSSRSPIRRFRYNRRGGSNAVVPPQATNAKSGTPSQSKPKDPQSAQEQSNDQPSPPKMEKSKQQLKRETIAKTEFTKIDWEEAKELDEAVIPLSGTTTDDLIQDVKILPLDSLYASQMQQQQQQQEQDPVIERQQQRQHATDTLVSRVLERPEQYQDRIGHNRRRLAVNIASSIESVSQWRQFCQEGGGLFPLLETIREGSACLLHQQSLHFALESTTSSTRSNSDGMTMSFDGMEDLTISSSNNINYNNNHHHNHQHNKLEESFMAACSACRALRDICALSPEVAAVVTDGILRANHAWEGGLFQDLTNFLKHASLAAPTDLDIVDDSDSEQQPISQSQPQQSAKGLRTRWRQRRDARLRCKLYVTQLLLAMAIASDDAIAVIRSTKDLDHALLECSSYARKEQTRRWLRYPGEIIKYSWRKLRMRGSKRRKMANVWSSRGRRKRLKQPFLEAATVSNDLNGQVQKTSNQVLASIGYNRWVPKIPGQKGLRILCLDGGGSRGMTAVTAVKCLMDHVGNGLQPADCFDIIAGTSTGGIISFLTGLRGETATQTVQRYNQLIKQIFVKSALSTPRLVVTTAAYDESYFMEILSQILGDETMLDSRAEPSTPYVFCVTSKMSSTPTHVALFRNYNYASGELADHFTIDPGKARQDIDIPLDLEHPLIRSAQYSRMRTSSVSPGVKVGEGSRHPGSFRVLQRYALRASTAAPTFFKPVMLGGEMYCDGGIVASNPSAVAIHEARTLFPDVPIEMVVSCGTGCFTEQKSTARFGWDAIIGQIVGSATDGEQIHHILEDILGDPEGISTGSSVSKTAYYRFNPVLGPPDEFPIDVTDPAKLARIRQITTEYMSEPAQQAKMQGIANILKGRPRWRKWFSR